jgi:hypothetical protein
MTAFSDYRYFNAGFGKTDYLGLILVPENRPGWQETASVDQRKYPLDSSQFFVSWTSSWPIK